MYQHILVAVDGSPTSNLALLEAAKLASAGATLRLVTAVEDPSWAMPLEPGAYDQDLLHSSLLKGAKDILERAKTLLKHKGIDARTHLLDLAELPGTSIPSALLAEAQSWPADVIVIGTHGRRGINRLLMGSVAETLIRSSNTPVLLVRAAGSKDEAGNHEATSGEQADAV
ncbi:MAG: universal stress protein [Moraxellaceae bacterium]